ncbi:Protein of unknown function (DUF3037) [Knoellia remsis]|uniref:DUF3037 family protein n=1 Tax=Knoellia remsis TaxID=407159 RepID=A0A2T0UAF1_9MICO|nr:DUF3037 domain-containing protein [Knoellia remsis]PRY54889.1 Protein of unknown function (DUF3037) [Knoellia remsis]
MSGHPYQYVVLKCVPRVDRGECLNVGVVLFSQSAGFLRAATWVDEARLRAFAPDLDVEAVSASLAVIDEVCTGASGGGRPTLATPGKRFGWLSAPRSTVIQPSAVHGGTAEDPEAELALLLERLVR